MKVHTGQGVSYSNLFVHWVFSGTRVENKQTDSFTPSFLLKSLGASSAFKLKHMAKEKSHKTHFRKITGCIAVIDNKNQLAV
jgi:hypothetical protein